MPEQSYSAFRLGDIRGIYPAEIDETFVGNFGRAFVEHFNLSGIIAVGRDMRESSLSLQNALIDGLLQVGIEVQDLGLCATELGYFASTKSGISATIIVTASHNPEIYNGLKCVLKNGIAVTYETGLSEVEKIMQRLTSITNEAAKTAKMGDTRKKKLGTRSSLDLHPAYIEYLKQQFPIESLSRAELALNGLNGTAVTLAGELTKQLGLSVTWFRKLPGPMPSQGADPANPMLTRQMKKYMSHERYDLGIAWDGDCDRCVFFDSEGDLIPSYYVVGLLAQSYLEQHPGAAIVFDTKLCWNTLDVISRHGGKPVRSETGHAFMKRRMRESNAIYGGELSSHHFFGEFHHCDSGMMAMLRMLQILKRADANINELVTNIRQNNSCTPEINLKLIEPQRAFDELSTFYQNKATHVETFDGLHFEFKDHWRFSITQSKTEPLVRLNFESNGSSDNLLEDASKVLAQLSPFLPDKIKIADLLSIQ
ncbi:MAG: phosphomannomutase [Candidatus Azotimanducaceae bacterium]|jgi:phosphomannomutase